jgi:hypothetical protein
MADPIKTDIEGDVTNSLSGSFSGPVTTDDRTQTQSVSVVVQQAVKQDLPPELQNATLHQMVLGLIQAIQDLEIRLWKTAKTDQEDRKERQGVADTRHEETLVHRESVNAQLDMLTIKTYDTADTVADAAVDIREVRARVSRLEILYLILGAAVFILVGFLIFWLVMR